MLAREVHLGMHNTHVSCQRIVARECLLFSAQGTADLLLTSVVDSVLVTGEIVWTREDRVARLASCGVDALTLVRPRLRVAV